MPRLHARRSSAEHLIATKALRCTATAWFLTVAESFAKFWQGSTGFDSTNGPVGDSGGFGRGGVGGTGADFSEFFGTALGDDGFFAGGGGGGSVSQHETRQTPGGKGGGGKGNTGYQGQRVSSNDLNGQPGTGGGGGGSADGGNGAAVAGNAGGGGSGIVIIAYAANAEDVATVKVNGKSHGGVGHHYCPSLDPVACGATLAGVTAASSAGALTYTFTRNGDSPIAIALSAIRITDIEKAPKQSIGDVTATGLAVSNPVHLQFGEFDKACTREVEGTLRFSNGALQVCVSSAWKTISLQS